MKRMIRSAVRKRGFTLVELLVIIAIIGVLSSVVLVSLNVARSKSRLSAGKQLEANLHHAAGDQMIGWWTFDECSGSSAYDSAGSGYTATLVGAPTWNTDTPYGRGCSLQLSTTATYATIDNNAASIYSVQPNTVRTFSVWFKNTGLTGNTQQIIWKEGGCIGWEISMFNSGRVFGYFTTPGCGTNVVTTITTAGSYADSEWHFAVLTLDRISGKMIFYVDGQQIGTASISTTNPGSGGAFLVGTNWNFTQNFVGSIDEVRAYGTSFSLAEVERLYAEGLEKRGLARE